MDTALNRKKRGTPKGRAVDATALAEVQALLGNESRQRHLLIEHLHKIQDRYGHISSEHVVALAREMNLASVEVYEVASFYHHFDIVKDRDHVPPALTVRVCDSLSCELAGAQGLLEKLKTTLGADVRVIPAPCIGRCEQAPAAVVGQNPIPQATVEKVQTQVAAKNVRCAVAKYIDYDEYRAQGGYELALECLAGKRDAEDILKTMEDPAFAVSAAPAFTAGRKWRILRGEPTPRLMAINIDEGEPGTFKDRYFLERDPHRFLEGTLIAAWTVGCRDLYLPARRYAGCREILEREIAALQANLPCAIADLPAARRRRLYLRRRIRDDRVDRRQAGHAASAAAVCGAGRAYSVSRRSSTTWKRCTGCATSWRKARHGSPATGVMAERSTVILCERPRQKSRRQSRAGRHHGQRANRRILRRHARGHTFYAYLPGGAWWNSAGIDGRHSARFRHAEPYGCFIGSAAIVILSNHDKPPAPARNLMKFFRREPAVNARRAASARQRP